jgi:aspartyl-tRNA(Asn)/glutamyl-tRNA(Gln) amidotransferase subunit A
MNAPRPAALPADTLAAYAAAAQRDPAVSVQAVEACRAAIAHWQPRINAFRRLDAPQTPVAGPLAGAPLAHKDMYYRAGQVSTCGSAIRRDWIATETATVLERLDAAGAVHLGTLNMTEFAYGPTGQSETFGDVRNPWNTGFITGGSSSGSGAAVAARLVYAALGSDTGGSVRLPASACGVTGLKPTWGRVSRAGAMPLAHSLDSVGPLARTAEDCAMILGVIAGADPRDPQCVSRPADDYVGALATGAAGLRVGWSRVLLAGGDPDVCDVFERTLPHLAKTGVILSDAPPPDVERLSAHCMTLMQVEASALHGNWMRTRADEYESGTRARLQAGFAIPATVYVDALRFRTPALERFLATTLAGIDAFVLPTVPVRIPKLEETLPGAGPDMARKLGDLTRFTRWVNYLGVPAVTVPCGIDERGLPVGLQIVGRPFAEATVLRIAHAFQQVTNWHRRVPVLH